MASGALGIGWQLLSLTVAIVPAVVGRFGGAAVVSASAVTHFLVGGIVASRLGLWLFDLCVGQLLQEEVSANELGADFRSVCFSGMPLLNLRIGVSCKPSFCMPWDAGRSSQECRVV